MNCYTIIKVENLNNFDGISDFFIMALLPDPCHMIACMFRFIRHWSFDVGHVEEGIRVMRVQ